MSVNIKRIAHAANAMEAYGDARTLDGMIVPHGSDRDSLAFLLIDLRHWADEMGVDYTWANSTAQVGYENEKRGTPTLDRS